jgi:type II secretory pathway pseudopilin PulG
MNGQVLNSSFMKTRTAAFSMLEAIVALALLLAVVGALSAYSGLDVSRLQEQQRLIEAEALVQEGRVLVQLLGRQAWSNLNTNVTSLQEQQGVWSVTDSSSVEQVGDYQRRISLAPVCRDNQNLVVVCPGSMVDAGAYQLKVNVTWLDVYGQSQQVDMAFL